MDTKKFILLATLMGMAFILLCWVLANTASAASFPVNPGGVHFKVNPPYNCAITKKPATPEWVWYRYTDKKHPKRDAYNNKKVDLIWEDSDRAHEVEIRFRPVGTNSWKKKTEADDARATIKKLKNGKFYEFQVRGVSNCGKSEWGKTPKNNGIRQYIKP